MWYKHSISNYSKAPWGLSVLSRVTCIFTGTKISPSLSLRQCPNRYAFRAGRNLPDKEFRYLRTVIVYAVYWGFNSDSPKLTHPLNLPAPGRRQPLYFILRFCRDLCFDKQSLIFTAADRSQHPFSRSYGVILPSSLTRVRSLTLGYSPRLPVSVYGTGSCFLTRSFLGSVTSGTSLLLFRSPSQLVLKSKAFNSTQDSLLDMHFQSHSLAYCVPPLLKQNNWYRNINLLSIASPIGISLGPD